MPEIHYTFVLRIDDEVGWMTKELIEESVDNHLQDALEETSLRTTPGNWSLTLFKKDDRDAN